MRAAFGLGSVLVTALLIAWLWASYTAPVAHTAKQIKPEMTQLAGRNIDQTPAADSLILSGVEKPDHTLSGLKVDSIIPACAFENYYGLQAGDVIHEEGPGLTVGQSPVDSVDAGKDFLVQALEYKYDLVVDRGGLRINLPSQRNTLAPSQVGQMAGRNQDGTPAGDSLSLAPVTRADGGLVGLRVATISPGILLDYFGLQQGDTVLQIGQLPVGSTTIDTVESGKDMMVDALENKRDLLVDRGGQQIHLPAQRDAPATPVSATPTVAGQTPSAATTAPGSAVTAPPPPRNAQGQTLDLLNKIGAQQRNQDQQ